METNFILAGFGGQGILLAGTVLANAFMRLIIALISIIFLLLCYNKLIHLIILLCALLSNFH